MNTTRLLTVGMTALLVAGSAARVAEPAPDPRTTLLPIYTLPAYAETAAALQSPDVAILANKVVSAPARGGG